MRSHTKTRTRTTEDHGTRALTNKIAQDDIKTSRRQEHQAKSSTTTMAPRATRRQAVVGFGSTVALFEIPQDDRFPSSASLGQSIEATVRFSTISVGCLHTNQPEGERPGFVNMRVSFWVDVQPLPLVSCAVPVPSLWTPRIVLAAICLSIRRKGIVTIIRNSSPAIGGDGNTVNDVHWLFAFGMEEVMDILQSQNSFLYIVGGGIA